MGQKYFSFCHELRKAALGRGESTLLLKGLGFVKTRISEILKVSEVSDELWERFASKEIGFKSVLALGRGDESGPDGSGGEGEEEATKPKKKKERKLPKEFQAPFVAAMEDFGDSLKASGEKDCYVFRYENEEKRTYILRLQAVDAAS